MPRTPLHIETPQKCPLCHLHPPNNPPSICPHLRTRLRSKYVLEKDQGDIHASDHPTSVLPDVSRLSMLEAPAPSTFLTSEDPIQHSQATYYDLGPEDVSPERSHPSMGASGIAIDPADFSEDPGHPGYPWVRHVEGGSSIEIPDNQGVFRPATFVRFGLLDGEPTIWGTEGGQGEVTQYAESLYAQPSHLPSAEFVDDSDLRCFDADQLFVRGELRAVEILGDFGLLAELYRLQRAHTEERNLQDWKRLLDDEASRLERERALYYARADAIAQGVKEVRGRLRAAKVRTRIAPFLDKGMYLGEGSSWVQDTLQQRLTLARRNDGARVFAENAPHMGPARRIVGGAPSQQEESSSDSSSASRVGRARAERRVGQERNHWCKWCRFVGHFDENCDAPHQGCRAYACRVPVGHRASNDSKTVQPPSIGGAIVTRPRGSQSPPALSG
jgi:hypothetical protein